MGTRRRFLAAAASVATVGAGGVAPAKGVAVQQSPPHPDALLLSRIAKFNALEHQIRGFYTRGATPIEDDDEWDVVRRPFQRQQEALLEGICAIRATTYSATIWVRRSVNQDETLQP